MPSRTATEPCAVSPSLHFSTLWFDPPCAGKGSVDGKVVVLGLEGGGGGSQSDEGTVENVHAEDAEDVVPRRLLPTPDLPSQSEVDEHMVDHVPYRHWCRCCREGFGREAGHYRVSSDRSIPVVAFDYVFITKRGVMVRKDLVEGEENDPAVLKILAVRDTLSKAIAAYGVPRKGVDQERYSVNCVVQFVLWLGYSRIILQSDNESPSVLLLKEALKALRVEGLQQTHGQHPVAYDPAGNGAAEVGVQLVKGRLSTCKMALEMRLQHRIPPTAPIIYWLVAHAMFTYNIRKGHEGDGRTADHRIKGRDFSTKLLEFREVCSFRVSDADMGTGYRVRQGISLGFDQTNAKYLVHSEDRAFNVRTVTRLPNSMKWSAAHVQSVRSLPWDNYKAKR